MTQRIFVKLDGDGFLVAAWDEAALPQSPVFGEPDGEVVGFQEHPMITAAIADGAIEVSADQRQILLNGGRWDPAAGVATPFTPPEPGPVVPASVSDRQFFQALAIRGEITEDEALDAVGPGIIPAAMLALIDQLPEAERFAAKMLIRGATVFERANPLADLIGSLFGWDAVSLDEFWTFAATL